MGPSGVAKRSRMGKMRVCCRQRPLTSPPRSAAGPASRFAALEGSPSPASAGEDV